MTDVFTHLKIICLVFVEKKNISMINNNVVLNNYKLLERWRLEKRSCRTNCFEFPNLALN